MLCFDFDLTSSNGSEDNKLFYKKDSDVKQMYLFINNMLLIN